MVLLRSRAKHIRDHFNTQKQHKATSMANVSAVTPLNQLTKEKDDYKIEVKIRAGIEKDVIRYFDATLKEGLFLYLSRFSVIDIIDDKIKFITNPYKIMIYNTTKV
ncbi:uncharacterized protein [Rutidosis leptorrhynchoides]|uniref:uncharacterized protein n=1 Tax=Rutidosis leptorrhynchoides TaxID=125765 RepID=UPI003A98EAD2